jgi:hypothetical protein
MFIETMLAMKIDESNMHSGINKAAIVAKVVIVIPTFNVN